MVNKNEVKEMMEGGDCLIHCASCNRNEKETNPINVLYPEIEGILNLLTVAKELKYSRFILVSSISNVMGGKFKRIFNESNWADPEYCDLYERAKYFVEKTLQNFVNTNKLDMKYTVFLPGIMIGPLLKDCETSTSIKFFKKIVKKQYSKILNVKIPVVDVRDVSMCILNSIKNISSFN